MADSKKRFLLVPDDAWAEATLVSATSQAGLTVAQPDEDTVLGDLRVVVSGDPTGEVSESLTLSRAGITEDARFTYAADNASAHAVFREGGSFFTDSPDVLSRYVRPLSPSTTVLSYHSTPIWLEVPDTDEEQPLLFSRRNLRQDRTTVNGGSPSFTTALYRTVLNAATDSWSPPVQVTLPSAPTNLAAYAATRAEGVHVLVSATQPFAVGAPIWVYTHFSEDNGATFSFRSRVVVYPEAPSPTAGLTSLSAVALPSGRLCVLATTNQHAFVLTSDDLGLTWQRHTLLETLWASSSPPASLTYVTPISTGALLVEPSGLLVAVLSHLDMDGAVADATPQLNEGVVRVYLSTSGEAWGGGRTSATAAFSSLALSLDPEGRPVLRGQLVVPSIQGGGSASDKFWNTLAQMSFSPRFQLGDEPDDILNTVSSVSGEISALPQHVHRITDPETVLTPTSTVNSASGGTPYDTWTGHYWGVAERSWRGRSLVASCFAREWPWTSWAVPYVDGSLAYTSFTDSSALVVYKTCTHTNLKEKLAQSYRDSPATSLRYGPTLNFSSGRSYNCVWDAWDHPEYFGFTRTLVGAAAPSFVTETDGRIGMYTSVTTGQQLDWALDSAAFPNSLGAGANATDGLTGAVRFHVKGLTGGSTLRDEAHLRIAQTDSYAGAGWDVSLRMQVVGSDLLIAVYDNVAAITLQTATVTGAADAWVEFVFAATNDAVDHYATPSMSWRLAYRLTGVGSFQSPKWYTLLPEDVLATSAGVAADRLQFGHTTVLSSSTKFYWRGVHYHRPNTFSRLLNEQAIPVVGASALVSEDWSIGEQLFASTPITADNVYAGTPGQAASVQTMTVSSYPQYVQEGVCVSASGRVAYGEGTGSLLLQTQYLRGALNVLPTNPVLQEYRSAETDPANSGAEEVRLVFELPTELTGTAMALFGRNTPAIRIEMNSSDSWAAAPVDIQICSPYDPVVANNLEYGFLYSTDSAATGPVFTVQDNVVSMDSLSPWRKHQFRSQETGQKFFAVLYAGFSQTNVYEIVDNTENKLILNAPGGAYVSATDLVVFSDRVAFDLGALMSTAGVQLKYVRVTFLGCRWPTTEQQHHRLGALWFGSLFNLSEPDFEWQWGRVAESGNTRTDTPGGATYSKRNRQFRRIFTASKPTMQSARVSNGVDSPQEQIRGSWEEFINLTERLEIDGKRCALIWQGERAEAGSQVDPVQRTADPLELIACRMDSGGTLQNDAYSCQSMMLGSSGLTAVPRPRASIAQIQFREEF